MTQPIFIQSGFKNRIFVAFLPLFAAIRLAQGARADDDRRWLLSGALAAIAVLLRETVVPFLIIGAVAVLAAYGGRACMRFSGGAALAGVTVMLLVTGER